MAFQAAPIVATSPDEPQAAGVPILELVPTNTLVLTDEFAPAPTLSSGSSGGGQVGYAM